MIQNSSSDESISDFLEVLKDNLAIVRVKIEQVQNSFNLLVEDSDPKLKNALKNRWPLDTEPSKYVSFDCYKAMKKLNDASARYISRRYKEADKGVTGLGLLDLLYVVEITESEIVLIESEIDFDAAPEELIDNIKVWIYLALEHVRRVNETMELRQASPIETKLSESKARKSQASSMLELNKLNKSINNAEKPLNKSFASTAPVFYRLMALAISDPDNSLLLDSLLLDQQRRIEIYRDKTKTILDAYTSRHEARSNIWQLSDIGRSIPQSGSRIMVEGNLEEPEISQEWQSVDASAVEDFNFLGSHTDFDDLDQDHHPQYLLRSGDHLLGDVLLQGVIDGLKPSTHSHTGSDGSKRISGEDIYGLPDSKIEEDLPPQPKNFNVERMDLDVIPPGFSVVDTTVTWEGYDRYTHEIESRIILDPEDAKGTEADDFIDKIWVTGRRLGDEGEPLGPILYAVDQDTLRVEDYSDLVPKFLESDSSDLVKTEQGAVIGNNSVGIMIINVDNRLHKRSLPFTNLGEPQDTQWEELPYPTLYTDLPKDRSIASDGFFILYIAKNNGSLVLNTSYDLAETWTEEADPLLDNGKPVTCIDWANGRWYRWCDNSTGDIEVQWTLIENELVYPAQWSEDFENGADSLTLNSEFVYIDNVESYTGSQSLKFDGNDEHNSSRRASVEVETGPEGGTLTFWYKVSTEDLYDTLNLLVNGEQVGGPWSGVAGWTEFSVAVPPGTNLIEWQYNKDFIDSENQDTAWIDDITITNSDLSSEIVVLPLPDASNLDWTTITLPNEKDLINIVVSYVGADSWVVAAGDNTGYTGFLSITNDDGVTWQDFSTPSVLSDVVDVQSYTNTAWHGGALFLDQDKSYTYYPNLGIPTRGTDLPAFPLHPDLNWDILYDGLYKNLRIWYLSQNGVVAATEYNAEEWVWQDIDTDIVATTGGAVINKLSTSRIFGHHTSTDSGKPPIYLFVTNPDSDNNSAFGQGSLIAIDPVDPSIYTECFGVPEGDYGEITDAHDIYAATVAISDGIPTLFVLTEKHEIWKSSNLYPNKPSDWIYTGTIADPFFEGSRNYMVSYGESIKATLAHDIGDREVLESKVFNLLAESFDGGKTWQANNMPNEFGKIQVNNGFWWMYRGDDTTGQFGSSEDSQYAISRDGIQWEYYSEVSDYAGDLEEIDEMAWTSDGEIGLAVDKTRVMATETGGEIWAEYPTYIFDTNLVAWSCWVNKNDELMLLADNGVYKYIRGEGRFQKVQDPLPISSTNTHTDTLADEFKQATGMTASYSTIHGLDNSDLGYLIEPSDGSEYTKIVYPPSVGQGWNIYTGAYLSTHTPPEQPPKKKWLTHGGLINMWGADGTTLGQNPYLNPTTVFTVNTANRDIQVGDLIFVQCSSGEYSGFTYYGEWVNLPDEWEVIANYPAPDQNSTHLHLSLYKVADESDVAGASYSFQMRTKNDNFANQGDAQYHGWNVTVVRPFEEIVGFGDTSFEIRNYSGPVSDWDLRTPADGHRILVATNRFDNLNTFIAYYDSKIIIKNQPEEGVGIWEVNRNSALGAFGGRAFPNRDITLRTQTGNPNEGAVHVAGFLPVFIKNNISAFVTATATSSMDSYLSLTLGSASVLGSATSTATMTTT